MKLTLNHRFLRPDKTLAAQIRQKLSKLESLIKIEAAEVTLERNNESSPPFSAKVLLVIPGPDLYAEEKDHTPAATLHKVLDKLSRQIRQRKQKNVARRRTDEHRPWTRSNSSPSLQGA